MEELAATTAGVRLPDEGGDTHPHEQRATRLSHPRDDAEENESDELKHQHAKHTTSGDGIGGRGRRRSSVMNHLAFSSDSAHSPLGGMCTASASVVDRAKMASSRFDEGEKSTPPIENEEEEREGGTNRKPAPSSSTPQDVHFFLSPPSSHLASPSPSPHANTPHTSTRLSSSSSSFLPLLVAPPPLPLSLPTGPILRPIRYRLPSSAASLSGGVVTTPHSPLVSSPRPTEALRDGRKTPKNGEEEEEEERVEGEKPPSHLAGIASTRKEKDGARGGGVVVVRIVQGDPEEKPSTDGVDALPSSSLSPLPFGYTASRSSSAMNQTSGYRPGGGGPSPPPRHLEKKKGSEKEEEEMHHSSRNSSSSSRKDPAVMSGWLSVSDTRGGGEGGTGKAKEDAAPQMHGENHSSDASLWSGSPSSSMPAAFVSPTPPPPSAATVKLEDKMASMKQQWKSLMNRATSTPFRH